ncbi:hypothetical protein OESDEN_20106 [Oesophagostomum dentatum]|uniref:Uncharacterized protein n=1 Tax=Oesophagostomum dentatum TaxID=61180 RepID=A0A0B1S9N0_OESDE|nr:hypothetical protein OESDEN_20106 [Oesophagostomum dentatum]
MGASANPQPEIPVKKRFKESDFTPYPDSHRYFCALCSDLRLDLNMKASSQNKKKNLILLACQLASNNTGSRLARKVYSEICSTRKRSGQLTVFQQAVFIGDEVKKNTGSVPILGLDTIPLETWQNLFEKIQASGSLIDNEQILEPKDLVYFYYDCLVIFRGSEGWEIYTKEFGCDAAALPSTSGVPSPPSDTSPVNEDCTESPGPANFTVKLEAREHDDEDDLDEREPMDTSTQQQIMCDCCICNESVSQRKCCSTSERRETNLLLISCLVMSKSLGLERARSAYSKIARARCSVCKGHYTYAGIVIGRELERLQCTLPTHGVGVTLRFTWVDMLMKILAVSVLIDNEVVLSAADVEQFHSECSSGFHTELPPVNITPKCESDSVQDSEPLFNDNAVDPNSANSNVKEEVRDFPEDAEEEDDQEATSNHSSDEDIEDTLVAENQHSDEDTEKGQVHFTSFFLFRCF